MRRIAGAAQLKILHAREKAEQLVGLRIVIETRACERDEHLVGRLEGRQATFLRLSFDDIAARRRRREAHARQALQARAEF